MVGSMDDDSTVMAANEKRLGLLPEDRAYLLVLSGPAAGQLLALTKAMVLGRGNEADLRISEEMLSRKHCRVFVRDGETYVEDLQSSNGTFVNDARVASGRLRDGDKLRIGETTILKFTHADDNLEAVFHRRI
jgi:predicted component of type VI protein secretion system